MEAEPGQRRRAFGREGGEGESRREEGVLWADPHGARASVKGCLLLPRPVWVGRGVGGEGNDFRQCQPFASC